MSTIQWKLKNYKLGLLRYVQKFLKLMFIDSAANKYYSSASHHEQKNKKTTCQIKYLAVTIRKRKKLVLQHFPCK